MVASWRSRPKDESQTGARTNSRQGRCVLTTGTAFPYLIITLTILANMTKEGIERAVAKGEPRALAEGTFSVTYEAMFPGGIAVVMYAPQHILYILTCALQ
jgi:hypothetical protein